MKIIFICGSLEPGQDGVGDYTRILAEELIKQGHRIAIIALNDKHFESMFADIQPKMNLNLSMLRLPSDWSTRQRFNHAKIYIKNFEPDWLSLQYVPFSFNTKGLPFGLSLQLKLISYGKPWHIMFHELWVGMDEGSNIKFKVWGTLQRWLIQSLRYFLHPAVVHTQTILYQLQLTKVGFDVKYLPLFSNIKVEQVFSGNGERLVFSGSENALKLVLFGGIHADAPVERFAMEASSYSKENGIEITLIIIGRSGTEQFLWEKIWKSKGLNVKIIGEKPSEVVSKILKSCDFGISTTPIALSEKSGSVAAMLEHGLPVIAVSKSWVPKENLSYRVPLGVTIFSEGNFKSCINYNTTFHNNKISEVAIQFIRDLKEFDF